MPKYLKRLGCRRVTYGQLEQLWEFLNSNKELATGYNKTAQAREFSKNMWENIAQNLNSHGNGAVKDWKGWCKYWNDYKCKIKKLAAATRASHQQTGGGPSQIKKMTDVEKKFLQILGDDFGSGLPGTRVEPFEQDEQETGRGSDTLLYTGTSSVSTALDGEMDSESILTLCPVQIQEEMTSGTMRLGPSTPVTPPPAIPPALEPTTSAAAEIQSTPRRSPRRRRHTRREPAMTQEAARRALICTSERRANIEERRANIEERRANIEEQHCQTLKNILQEMKEIKEMLRLRSVERPTDGEWGCS